MQQSHAHAMITLMEDILQILYQQDANEMVNFYVNGLHFTTNKLQIWKNSG